MSFIESSLPLDDFPLARGGVLKDAQITYRVHGEIEDGTAIRYGVVKFVEQPALASLAANLTTIMWAQTATIATYGELAVTTQILSSVDKAMTGAPKLARLAGTTLAKGKRVERSPTR